MDSDFSAKLQSILSNPEAMAKISAIASNMGGNPPAPQSNPIPPQQTSVAEPIPQNPIPSLPITNQSTDPKLTLLSSIKPLLREEKRGKVDSLLTALAVANMLKSFKK